MCVMLLLLLLLLLLLVISLRAINHQLYQQIQRQSRSGDSRTGMPGGVCSSSNPTWIGGGELGATYECRLLVSRVKPSVMSIPFVRISVIIQSRPSLPKLVVREQTCDGLTSEALAA